MNERRKAMKNKSLPQLIKQAQNHEEAAFNELYRRYVKLVRYIAFHLTKNNADTDEVVQEVFIQVQRSIQDLKDANHFKAWLSRITYSKAKMLFRKNKDYYMAEEYLDVLHNKEESRAEYLPQKHNRHQSDLAVLYTCMERLKPYYREVLLLYYFSELNIKEITELTALPEGTVKSRLLYAKKYLRAEIEHYEQTSGQAITFQGRSLEAALTALGASFINESIKCIPFTHWQIPNSTWMLAMKGALIGVLGIGVVGGAGMVQQMRQSENKTIRPFPGVVYQTQNITTAREAYQTLIEFADCDVELREKSAQQLAEIQPVYMTLMSYGEGYAELLKRRNWDQLFEQYQ